MSSPHQDAFLKAFDEYADALFRHASLRLADRERVLDLTQEAFLKAWEHVRGGGEVRHWKGFLFRILNNLIIDEYRKKKNLSLEALEEDNPGTAEALLVADGRGEKETALDHELMLERVLAELPRLPENYRAALILRFVDGFSQKEAAQLLGVSENVVSVRVHRALARLKELCAFPPHTV